MSTEIFEFEKPIVALEQQHAEAQKKAEQGDVKAQAQLAGLEEEIRAKKVSVYANLTPWERVLFARHKNRPRSLDYIKNITTEFIELHGDRNFGDDKAVIVGTARLNGEPVMMIGQQKGKDTKENVERNFGMMHPEGYRKALRAMRLADKFGMPIIIFVDTPGAFPGIGAEERGQAEAIAYNIQEMMGLKVPIVMTVIGEGASGGALGIGLADCVLMLENAWYCVISPEGCAAILWKDAANSPKAAEVLKLTGPDLKKLGVIDDIIPEPLGGAHRHPQETFEAVAKALTAKLKPLKKLTAEKLQDKRFDKYRSMGVFLEEKLETPNA
ncbi:MAG: acetyl-CoA carboxylase carboxyltransferase subunit alpha [Sumerlaeia bacterium]